MILMIYYDHSLQTDNDGIVTSIIINHKNLNNPCFKNKHVIKSFLTFSQQRDEVLAKLKGTKRSYISELAFIVSSFGVANIVIIPDYLIGNFR